MREARLSPSLTARVDDHDGTSRIALAGELDVAGHDELLRLMEAGGDSQRVLLDLAQVEMVDSTGLAAMLAADQQLAGRGAALLLEGARGAVARTLELTGIGRRLGAGTEPPAP